MDHFKIDLYPIFEGKEYYYRLVICRLEREERGSEALQIEDILHFDRLAMAVEYLASNFSDVGSTR